mgnify:FL=1
MQDISLEELTKIKGIGIVKAIQIKAVCEMAKRISKPLNANKVQIRSSASVANLLMNEMKYEKREKVKVLVLNTKNVLIKIIDVSYGGTNSAIIEPKDILAEPIKMGAPKIILVHNHPTGVLHPSKPDEELTKKIVGAGKILDIRLLDHLIISEDTYFSFADEGIIL